MPAITDHFDQLTDLGLKVIPLRANSKVPLTKCWQKDWSLNKSREKLLTFPESNLGLLLGDIIDVEGDSSHANNLLLDLIGDYPHPMYRSTKSIHHLFQTPESGLRLFKFQEIEFRGEGHQSVLPPSQHYGTQYKWIDQNFPVPEMPPRLLTFYQKITGKQPMPLGNIKVWCAACKKEIALHAKRFRLELEVFRRMSGNWECQSCRATDLRPLVRVLKQGHSIR